MGKKKQEEMDKQRVIFCEGAAEKGVDEKKANEVFDMMAKFAGYGFNKSHSVAYSLVAYHTAYLKAHYPAEYMAAAMTNDMGATDKLSVVLEEARHLGIDMLPPCVNTSHARFSVEGGKIRMGLGAIKGVGLSAIDHLVQQREKGGPFGTLYDLTSRIDTRLMGKKAIEGLIQSGAADALEGHRAQLCAALDDAVSYGQKVQRDKLAGQNSLFGGMGGAPAESMEPSLPVVPVWTRGEKLGYERDLLGFYVSGHPLDAYRLEAETFRTLQIAEIEPSEDEEPRRWGSKETGRVDKICGIITAIVHRTTRTGKPIVFATIEDYTGQAEIVLFAREFDRLQSYVKVDEVVLVSGTTEVRGGHVSIKAQDVMPMWKAREQFVKSIVVRLDIDRADAALVPRLAELCENNRGMVKLYFDLVGAELPEPAKMRVRRFVVDPTPQLMTGLTQLVGRPNISLLDSAVA
jgi:DNA polymerase-3 subunit alpha